MMSGREREALAALSDEEEEIASIEVQLEEDEPAGEAVSGTVACGACGVRLSVPSSGTYRCPRCRAALEVDKGGVVILTRKGHYLETQSRAIRKLALPTDALSRRILVGRGAGSDATVALLVDWFDEYIQEALV